MAVYIVIPEGMCFKKIQKSAQAAAGEIEDYFVDIHEGQNKGPELSPIPLQTIVKKALQHRKRDDAFVTIDSLTIYFKNRPLAHTEPLLKYTPENNGKLPTKSTPEVIDSITHRKSNPNKETSYGRFWYQNAFLTQEALQEILDKKKAQRDSRRHGNNPLDT